MVKNSYENVKLYFDDNECKLLEDKYISSKFPMKYICKCGNMSIISFDNFKKGKRCKKCAGVEKFTYEYVFNYFKENKCLLLENEYKNNRTSMKYRCSCGNESVIRFDSFKRGNRCKLCANKKLSDSKRQSYEDVYNYYINQSCELLEDIYIDCDTSMKYRCSCGNVAYNSFSNFKKGNRCKKCGIKKMSDSQRFSFEYVKQDFLDNKCELLENEYISAKTSMKYKCSCGNISKITFDSFRSGTRCSKCAGNEKHSYEYIFNYFLNDGSFLLDKEYTNCNTVMNYICSCGNISKICFSSFKAGNRCKKCAIVRISGPNHYKWNPDREQLKKNRQLSRTYRGLLRHTLESTGKKKNNKTAILLGYTKEDLLNHLKLDPLYEKWLNKINPYDYHIDHIIPIQAFLDHKIYDPKIINKLENLQILPGPENISKNDTYLEEDYNQYIKQFNLGETSNEC